MALDDREYMHEPHKRLVRKSHNEAIYNPKQFRLNKSAPDARYFGHRLMDVRIKAWIAAAIIALLGYAAYEFSGRQTFPQSGTIRQLVSIHPANLNSKVEIRLAAGHNFNHVIRFRSMSSQQDVLEAYMQPGNSMNVWLPAGEYEVTSLLGNKWMGLENGFSRSESTVPSIRKITVRAGQTYVMDYRKPVVKITGTSLIWGRR